LIWKTAYPALVNPPVLADLTGDGRLDILVTGWDDDVLLYDFNYGALQLVWSKVLSSTMSGTFGAPAVADIDGQQPGGDPGPEVAVSSNGRLTVLNGENGAVVWTTALDPGNPGGVSIADLDGDGEIEIVTGMRYEFAPGRFGKLYALNANGSVLWSAIAEDSTSANNASVLDLNGDNIYEVAWNGKEQGFTIFNGLNGAVLFNEPLVNSFTGTDYPLFADTDGDGQAEVVVPALRGIRVFGNGAAWGPARPLWNQHAYHITNVNDDLSIPFNEPDSWQVHNTYRTQTQLVNPMPVYNVSISHTAGLTGVAVLTNTFNITPTAASGSSFGWEDKVTWEGPVTYTFQSRLTGLQPGETHLVAHGTQADYVAPGGHANARLTLPPLYVNVAHIVDVQPSTRTVGAGATAVFSVTLANPLASSAQYSPTVGGLPTGWAHLPASVSVPAGVTVTVPLTVEVPVNAQAASLPFLVAVTSNLGSTDRAGGVLNVAGPLVQVDSAPDEQTVATGQVATYTLWVKNLEPITRSYNLSSVGLAALNLPAQITVSAQSTVSVAFAAQAVSEGPNPFTVIAVPVGGEASAQDTGVVTGQGFAQVDVTLSPATAPSGPGVPTLFDVMVANRGTAPTIFDLSVAVPSGWEHRLSLLGRATSAVMLAPGASNAATLQLVVTPAAGAAPGDYAFTVTAQSSSTQQAALRSASQAAVDTAQGVAQVGNLGVTVEILSGPAQLMPGGRGTWPVRVTRPGSTGSSHAYTLTAFGPLAAFAQISPTVAALAPGGSQTAQMTISGFDLALPQEYLLGVHARSQTLAHIQAQDTTTVTVGAAQGVQVDWQPNSLVVNGSTQAALTLVVTNTGNAHTTFQLAASAPGAQAQLPVLALPIPAHSTAALAVDVTAPGNGTYTITATANSGAAQDSASAALTVQGVLGRRLYLPIIIR
jgi:hypothetical protein